MWSWAAVALVCGQVGNERAATPTLAFPGGVVGFTNNNTGKLRLPMGPR